MIAWLRELMSVQEWKAAAWTGGRVLVILALAWLLERLARRLIRAFRDYMARRASADESRRVETLARVFHHIGTAIIVLVAGTLVLGELGISIAPILATAGVAGVAIGFGAQSLIKDYFNGFFLLLEDQIRQGDVVEIAGKSGLVEEINLRHVRLRDYDGHVHFVPNGEIKIVSNLTREHAYAVIDAGVAYRENAEQALEVMREVGAALRADREWSAKIVQDVEVAGVERWDDSALVLRCRLKVQPLEQWNVRREFLKRLKAAFDARGIEIPYPSLTLYPGQAKDGSAPALHVNTRSE
jgi:small conductance mechanosensitive channel